VAFSGATGEGSTVFNYMGMWYWLKSNQGGFSAWNFQTSADLYSWTGSPQYSADWQPSDEFSPSSWFLQGTMLHTPNTVHAPSAGNAATATAATNDSAGNNISTFYYPTSNPSAFISTVPTTYALKTDATNAANTVYSNNPSSYQTAAQVAGATVTTATNLAATSLTINPTNGSPTGTLSTSGNLVLNWPVSPTNYIALAYTGGTNVLVDFSLGTDFILAATNNAFFIPTNVAYLPNGGGSILCTNNSVGGWSFGYTNFTWSSAQVLMMTTNGGAWNLINVKRGPSATKLIAVQTLNLQ
jgi:hypothetical protein